MAYLKGSTSDKGTGCAKRTTCAHGGRARTREVVVCRFAMRVGILP